MVNAGKITDAVLGDTTANNSLKKDDHSQKQDPTVGTTDTHIPTEAGSNSAGPKGGRRVKAKLGHQLQCQKRKFTPLGIITGASRPRSSPRLLS